MTSNPAKQAALDFVSMGIPCIPVRYGDKIPAKRDWLNTAAIDADMVENDFGGSSPQNIGILTGPSSGLIIVDIDKKNGGYESLSALQDKFETLPETLTVNTGGGGLHFYYKRPADFTEVGDIIGLPGFPGIDIKNKGQVIAPPSMHKSGALYSWKGAKEPCWDHVVEAPRWLHELIETARTPKASVERTSNAGLHIPEGERNTTIFKLGCAHRARGCEGDQLLAYMRADNDQCDPGLHEDELLQIFSSVQKYDPGGGFEFTDLGNAKRLVHNFGGQFRFDAGSRSWYFWTGSCWMQDKDGEVDRRAKAVAQQLRIDANLCNDKDLKTALLKQSKVAQSAKGLRDAVNLAKTEPGIPISLEEFDRDSHLLNVANGTLDLKTGKLQVHDQADLITKIISTTYDDKAQCPVFQNMLAEIFEDDPQMISYVQTIFGYSTTGNTSDQSFFIFNGDGANGKSTLLNIIRSVLGPYASHVSTDTFLVKKPGGILNDLAGLRGIRYATVSESNTYSKLDPGLLKQISGDEPISARFLFGQTFVYQPGFKLLFATNHLPGFDGEDQALWRRLHVIPFNRIFLKHEQDHRLGDKLKAEMPGILNWLVQGAIRFYTRGIEKPDLVKAAISSYRADCDPVGQFLAENYQLGPKHALPASLIYSEYRIWAGEMGFEVVSQTALGNKLRRKGYESEKRSGTMYRLGLKPLPMLNFGCAS